MRTLLNWLLQELAHTALHCLVFVLLKALFVYWAIWIKILWIILFVSWTECWSWSFYHGKLLRGSYFSQYKLFFEHIALQICRKEKNQLRSTLVNQIPSIGHLRNRTQIVKEQNCCIVVYRVLPLKSDNFVIQLWHRNSRNKSAKSIKKFLFNRTLIIVRLWNGIIIF